MKKKPIALMGMQPSGELHVGNYLGSLKNAVELQNSGKYETYFFVADYHAMTEGFSPKELRENARGIMIDFLAAGLDPKKSTLFFQSMVNGHTELAWMFNTLTPMAELERMTQYKDKASRQKKNVNAGLFDYPVLQAADILLYHPKYIPVGQDQVQHVELTRKIVRWFNQRYGVYFSEPEVLLTETPRVMSLLEPTKKMSKSLGPNHYIGINDEPKVIKKKLSKAVSDSGDGNSAGGTNLLLLLEEFARPEAVKYFFKQKQQKKIKFGELKEQLADAIAVYFEEFREKRKALEQEKSYVDKVIADGAKKAEKVAAKTIKEVRELVGLI